MKPTAKHLAAVRAARINDGLRAALKAGLDLNPEQIGHLISKGWRDKARIAGFSNAEISQIERKAKLLAAKTTNVH